MKTQLQIVKPALGGPQSTTPTSRMVKQQDNRLWAYGGAFCISTPLTSPLECGFAPAKVERFFERDREGYSVTENENTLIFRHGIVTTQVNTLPACEIPSLQAIGPRIKITEQPTHLSVAASLCRNNSPDFTQAAWWKDGMVFSMLGRSVCFSCNGLLQDHALFGIPSDAMAALAKIKGALTSVVMDRISVQFEFEDGTWLASRYLDGKDPQTAPPDFMQAFVNAGNDTPIEFNPEAVKEIMTFKLSTEENGGTIDMTWFAEDGNLRSVDPYGEEVVLKDAYECEQNFIMKGEPLRIVLALKPEQMEITGRGLLGIGEGFAVLGGLMR